ncbi:heterokaryon incompatibility protein-domain-containing protein [Scleroderma yunnanense]
MYLINVQAFIKRHPAMSNGEKVDLEANVLSEFYDDRIPEYAILSHRWIDQEVNRNEMVELAKMEERHKVCQRPGYKKILASCEQAKNDNCEWLWVDTCCIDRQSNAELSEGINSMYRWYENSKVCYAYLHDVPGTLFPAEDDKRYPNFNGWLEWFSHGWTLQELIAPKHVQFFNQNWKDIGNKRVLAETLSHITGVPEHILTGGLSSKRPCVAQIMSWAANC